MLYVRRVVGDSMQPTLRPGAVLFAMRRKPRVGSIVIADINGREVVKRVIGIGKSGAILQGDNLEHSTDSRQYGEVALKNIKAVVLFR